MFNGSEHYDKEFQGPLERAGATDLNGTTNEDRTNYFENVPDLRARPRALARVRPDGPPARRHHPGEARRAARRGPEREAPGRERALRQGVGLPHAETLSRQPSLLVDRDRLDGGPRRRQAGRRQGLVPDLLRPRQRRRSSWRATSTSKTAKAKVERYFGDIPSGPPVARQETWIAKRTGSQRGVMQDRVPQARLYKVWNVPEWGSADGDYLGLAASALSTGKSSRLFKRLVYDEQIATDVDASVDLREIGGLFTIEAGVRPGVDPARVERAIDEELARLLAAGPTAVELQRAKTQTRAGFIRGVERIGGFGGKSDVLAKGEVFAGRPDYYKTQLARIAGATAAQVRGAAARWLSDGVYTLEVRPFPEYAVAPSGADRSALPAARHAAGREIPRTRARYPLQRPQDRPGRTPVDSAGAVRPAARRRLRGGPVRPAGHRQPRDEHARRGHHHAHGPPDQRPPRRSRRHAGRGVQARRVERVARDATRAARPCAGALRRRHPPSGLPQGRLRTAQEAAPGADPAREGRPDRHGPPGPSPGHLR